MLNGHRADRRLEVVAAARKSTVAARVCRLIRLVRPHQADRRNSVLILILLYVIAAALILTGLAGAVVPVLPGIPLIFAGIWLIAGVDQYRHIGLWWLVAIGLIGAVGLTIDLVAGALGAKRAAASRRAIWGALLGTLVGLFFGLPGLLLGPFLGAVLGELAAGSSMVRSTHVGASASIGLILGAVIKLVASLTMLALFGVAWWWNRP
jgi:uncharacterized protein YqgC (DUF456 family)